LGVLEVAETLIDTGLLAFWERDESLANFIASL
jgi:hypothetical protein